MNTTVEQIWTNFTKTNLKFANKVTPSAFYFCDNEKDANDCAELVKKEIKQATVSSLISYEMNNEKMPEIGELFIVTDWYGNAKAIIEISNVVITPFNKITAKFAKIEGEGDKSLAYWKKVHQAFFTRELQNYGLKFDENMLLVCELFKTVYKVD